MIPDAKRRRRRRKTTLIWVAETCPLREGSGRASQPETDFESETQTNHGPLVLMEKLRLLADHKPRLVVNLFAEYPWGPLELPFEEGKRGYREWTWTLMIYKRILNILF